MMFEFRLGQNLWIFYQSTDSLSQGGQQRNRTLGRGKAPVLLGKCVGPQIMAIRLKCTRRPFWGSRASALRKHVLAHPHPSLVGQLDSP